MKPELRMSEANEMVLDANVLVRLVVPGEYEAEAEALWDQALATRTPCLIPVFCPTEVISSLRQMGRGGFLTPEQEEQAFDEFALDIRPMLISIDMPSFMRDAWQIARQLDERHTYDSVYLA